MGSRAEIVVIDEGKQRMYYTQWGAESLHLDLLPGPESALRFATAQKEIDEWATGLEAGAVIDVDNEYLLWYSPILNGQDLLRLALYDTMLITWSGWRVRPAPFGVMDLADYCDGRWPRSTVIVPGTPQKKGHIYTSPKDVATLLERGPELVKAIRKWKPADRMSTLTEFGLMLDPLERHGGVWAAGGSSAHLQEIAERWPGWTWERWDDRWNDQLAEMEQEEPDPRLRPAFEKLSESFDRHQQQDRGSQMAAELLQATDGFFDSARKAGVILKPVVDNVFTHRPIELSAMELADTREAIAEAALGAV